VQEPVGPAPSDDLDVVDDVDDVVVVSLGAAASFEYVAIAVVDVCW